MILCSAGFSPGPESPVAEEKPLTFRESKSRPHRERFWRSR